MSDNHYVHLGIYIECSDPKLFVEVNDEAFCSKNKTHRTCNGAEFCSKCGSEIAHTKRTEPVRIYDVVFEDDDDYIKNTYKIPAADVNRLKKIGFPEYSTDDGFDILLPSNDEVFGKMIDDDEGVFDLQDELKKITDPKVAAEHLKKEIDLLTKYLYGSVEVKFGYVSNWG